MNLPLNPKAVAAEAIASGALRMGELRAGEPLTKAKDVLLYSKPVGFSGLSAIKTPQEAGIAAILPAPKRKPYTKRPAQKKRYVLTLAQLKAERPHLYL